MVHQPQSLPETDIIDASERIAEITGFTDAPKCEQLLRGITDSEIAMHGIRRVASVDSVLQKGVMPNCPDTTPPSSFWNSRLKVFFSDGSTMRDTSDTSFFQYAHTATPTAGTLLMTAALTNKQVIKDTMPRWDEQSFYGGYFSLVEPLAPRNFQLVSVEARRLTGLTARENGQLIERKMITALLSVVSSGLRLGEHTVYGSKDAS